MQQPTEDQYRNSQFVGEPPVPVTDIDSASIVQLRQEVKQVRAYIAHLYLAYKELVTLKADLQTSVNLAKSYYAPLQDKVNTLENKLQQTIETLMED